MGQDQPARLIDVHHHFMPPQYVSAVRDHILRITRIPAVLEWAPARSVEDMDSAGVLTAIVSVSTPGVWFGDASQARRLARECNEFAARMSHDYPGRFGFFAAIPLPDTEGSLREIEYALDTLHADGIGILTNYDGKYPGDAAFAPVFEELNRRKAAVYCHPTTVACCWNIQPDVHQAMMEFPFDTTRAVVSLLYSGILSRFRDIKFIFSHGGGTVPMLAGRIAIVTPQMSSLPNGVIPELKRLHFDTATVTNPSAMAAVLRLVPAAQVMFGTDYPWGTAAACLKGLNSLDLGPADRESIEYAGAHRLFPRLKAAAAASRA